MCCQGVRINTNIALGEDFKCTHRCKVMRILGAIFMFYYQLAYSGK